MEPKEIIQTIRTIHEMEEGFIPLHEPRFWGKEKAYLNATIDSTFVSSVGQYVDQVEEMLAKMTQTRKCAAVVNGTSALQVALRVAGVNVGEEVLTQALTFVATANAIAYNGAHPVFLDVDIDTMGLSATALETWLIANAEKRETGAFNKQTNRRIAACLPMHTFGFMCRMDKIMEVCDAWNIPVVEDAAEALGSQYRGQCAGSWGMMGAFSFNGNKIITSGGGGAVVSSDPQWAERVKYLTTTAKKPHTYEYIHEEMGYNFRMPNLNAALLVAQLEQLDTFITSKKNLFEAYRTKLDSVVDIPEGTEWNHWLISLELENKEERDAVLAATNEEGVMTRPIWQLMYRLPMYGHCQRDDQKNAEFLEERIINIPSSARR
ncbi:LegC family aminotransferase [Lewinella cohaerens]|uniref:LegC family aminotransferase n=1 Tax=Lewinella cohaerens TaxID=70995 RepID=UPI00037718CA|nr:LegC family aminotransferase [Lewinella cohaerens]